MIRRYAELSAAFVSVNEHCSDDTFHRLLSDMHMEIDHFIFRCDKEYLSNSKTDIVYQEIGWKLIN